MNYVIYNGNLEHLNYMLMKLKMLIRILKKDNKYLKKILNNSKYDSKYDILCIFWFHKRM